jgi:hypothetical protein
MYEQRKVTYEHELRVRQIAVRTFETELTFIDRKHDSSRDITGAIFNNPGGATSRTNIPIHKLTFKQPVTNFPAFCRNRTFITAFKQSLH